MTQFEYLLFQLEQNENLSINYEVQCSTLNLYILFDKIIGDLELKLIPIIYETRSDINRLFITSD